MSEIKHTLGPWTLETVRTSVGVCFKVGPFPWKQGKLNHACIYADYPSSAEHAECLANALLIAAAPELLSALQYINETLFEGEEWECDFDETESLCCEQCDEHGCMKAKAEAARAAIQKATGSA